MSNLKLSYEHDGQVARVVLAAPKANIVDQAMMEALTTAFEDLRNRPQIKVMILTAEGPHFSFGASVQEHLPEHVRTMLPRFSALLGQLLELPAVTLAAVRGQCLGGGFELALGCDFIVAEEGAAFACPEIKLAVFPPAAAVLLPARIGVSRAAELVLTGAAWSVAQAEEAGLIVRTAPQGQLEAMVETWIRDHFLARSPVALRYGVHAHASRCGGHCSRTCHNLSACTSTNSWRSPTPWKDSVPLWKNVSLAGRKIGKREERSRES
jgi:cyclohexa-1,5-dienecarbonyl-CoA hydratase